MSVAVAPKPTPAPYPAGVLDPAILPLLRELGDLKRVHSAAANGSIATRLFEAGWTAWREGGEWEPIAIAGIAQGVAAARLGDLDLDRLLALGMTPPDARATLARSLEAVGSAIAPSLRDRLATALGDPLPPADPETIPPAIAALRRQPRAGVTAPGRARIMLRPEENHAEHSFVVALYAGLVAPFYEADASRAFWHGMAHHLHSAAMPDSGYCGEVLLGDRLDEVIARARDQALADLPERMRGPLRESLDEIGGNETPEARAFHAADVIDRVLEIEHHLRGARLTMETVLDDYGLVHDGPVKPFHDRVLAEIGLP